MQMVRLVLDSSALISLSESCMVSVLKFLKGGGNVEFGAPPSVFEESVERPMKIRRYGFSAVRIKKLFLDGNVMGAGVVERDVESVLRLSNSLFSVDRKPLELVQRGEAECVAALLPRQERILVIDEKTLRLLLEDPLKLGGLLKEEYEGRVGLDEGLLEKWQQLTRGFVVLRSAELVAAAARRGYFDGFGGDAENAFHSSLHALKEFGCGLTREELKDYEEIGLGR